MKTKLSKLILSMILLLVGTGSAFADSVIDTLRTSQTSPALAASYKDWTISADSTYSGANYAGYAAIPTNVPSVFQFNYKKDTYACGIVSTVSGGRIKSITVNVNSKLTSTNSPKTIEVYAKTSAYSGVSDLYGNSTKYGTKYKFFTKTTKITFSDTDEYSYFGIRPNSGVVYIDNIIVEWEKTPTFTSNSLSLVATANSNYYATFSNEAVTFFPEAATVQKVDVKDGKLVVTDLEKSTATIAGKETTGYFVPAKTGVMLMSASNSITYYTVEYKTIESLEGDALEPSLTDETFTAEEGNKYYKLAYDNYKNKTGLGFYYGANDGGAFKVKKGTAYLKVADGASGAQAKGFNFDENVVDDIDDEAIATGMVQPTTPIYTLEGVNMGTDANAIPSGIYVRDHKKFVKE